METTNSISDEEDKSKGVSLKRVLRKIKFKIWLKNSSNNIGVWSSGGTSDSKKVLL